MNLLIANLGSTSFKYKLIDMSKGECLLAEGLADRIGQESSFWQFARPSVEEKHQGEFVFPTHKKAIDFHLNLLVKGSVLNGLSQIDAIGFKAVHGGPISGAVLVDDRVLEIMEEFSDVAPSHNPPYIHAMKSFRSLLPEVPQIAVFETAFHQTIPWKRQVFAIPYDWTDKLGIRRYGFHGASHSYVGYRLNKIDSNLNKVINCHLGGSSSVCALDNQKSVANSFGMTVQTGIPHANRVGDFDAFSILKLQKAGIDQATIWDKLSRESGLLGISGVSGDIRDLTEKAQNNNKRARLAIDVLVESVRHYIGAYLTVLNGVDAISFSGGIGQNSVMVREMILEDMDFAGIKLDLSKNQKAKDNSEHYLHHSESSTQLWIIPTNEELMVARQSWQLLKQH